MVKRPKRPRDPNQLGKLIVDLSVGEVKESPPAPGSSATEFARSGGLEGRPRDGRQNDTYRTKCNRSESGALTLGDETAKSF